MRIFIAALIPPEIKSAINNYVECLKPHWEGVKWEDYNKFHITLKFLGEVNESKIGDIEKIFREGIEGVSPFSMSIEGCGAFPSFKRPRVLYVELSQNEELLKFQQALEERLEEIGFVKDNRPFRCHVTIGRIKRKPKFKDSVRSPDSLTFKISELAIMRSILDDKGSKYNALSVFELTG